MSPPKTAAAPLPENELLRYRTQVRIFDTTIEGPNELWVGPAVVERYYYCLRGDLSKDLKRACLKHLPEGRKIQRVLGESTNPLNSDIEFVRLSDAEEVQMWVADNVEPLKVVVVVSSIDQVIVG